MTVRLEAALGALQGLAPLELAEKWDNVGLLLGTAKEELDTALLCIDLTPAVLDEALDLGAGLVVAYHPVVFEGLKRVEAGSVVGRALAHGVGVYCPHTALDAVEGGTNDVLAEALGMRERRALRRRPADGLEAANPSRGMGRVGTVEPTERGVLLRRALTALGLEGALVAGPREGAVSRVAVCAGSGRDLLGDALAQGAQLFLTGEVPHHDALRAARSGLTVVSALHSNSERATLVSLAQRLASAAPGLRCAVSCEDRDPYQWVAREG